MLDQALAEAWQAARKALGDDPSSWRWDALHKVSITHPLGHSRHRQGLPPSTAAGTGGDTSTVMALVSPGGSFNVAGGAYLMVVDVGGWDNSVFLNLPGQSADPRSPHRQDLMRHGSPGRCSRCCSRPRRSNRRASARTVLVLREKTPCRR
jgi:penicillin amidase